MRAILILLLLCASASGAARNLDMAGVARNYTFANVAAFSSFGQMRIEARFDSIGACSSLQNIWDFARLQIRCYNGGGSAGINVVFGEQSANHNLTFDASTPFILRAQLSSAGRFYAIACRVSNGAILTSAGFTGTAVAGQDWRNEARPVGNAASNFQVAWLNLYSTIAAEGTCPGNWDGPGDLASYTFDLDTGADTVNGMTVAGGALAFANTTLFVPVGNVSASQSGETNSLNVTRAGTCFDLDSASSYSLGTTSTLTRFWQQLAGPSKLRFTSRSGVTTQACDSVFGQYDLLLVLTDSDGAQTSKTVTVGAVPTDSNGVVVMTDTKQAAIFGPSIRFGKSPWPDLDTHNKTLVDLLSASYPFPQARFILNKAGTVTMTNGSATVAGSGTSFQTDMGCQPYTITNATNTSPIVITTSAPHGFTTGADDQAYIDGVGGNTNANTNAGTADVLSATTFSIRSSEGNGAYTSGGTVSKRALGVVKSSTTGNRWLDIMRCTSQTSLTILETWPFATLSGLSYGSETTQGQITWEGGSDNANYYDNVKAYYAMYYRTGLTKYLTAARTLADWWWENPGLSYKTNSVAWPGGHDLPGRSTAWLGSLWRIYEGGLTSRWPEARNYIKNRFVINTTATLGDSREEGYAVMYNAAARILDPDSTEQTYYSNQINGAATNRWTPQQVTTGVGTGVWIQEYAGYGDQAAYHSTLGLVNGSTSVTLNVLGTSPRSMNPKLKNMLEVPGDSTGYFLTASVGPITAGNSGTLTLNKVYEGTTRTHSTTNYGLDTLGGFGVQPFMIGLQGNAWDLAYRANGNATAKGYVATIAEWLRTVAYRPSTKGSYYARVFKACEPAATAETAPGACTISDGADPTITSNKQADRYITAETLRSFSGAVLNDYGSSQANILTAHGDVLVGAIFGGNGGPETTGIDGINPAEFGKNKTLGFFFGVGGSDQWPAVRLGGVAAANNRTLQVGVNLASVPNATQVRLTLTKPDGLTVTATCSSSPCAITADARQTNHLLRIEYLSAGNAVLATGEQQIAPVN